MALKDYVDLLPEDKRESFKAEIGKAIVIEDKDDAFQLFEKHDIVKRALKSRDDKKYAEMEEDYKKTKVPDLLKDERKKGEKQPWEIEAERNKAEIQALRDENARKDQKVRALEKAKELGIPLKIAAKAAGLTDDETDANLKELAEGLLPWRKEAVDAELAKVGSQPTPRNGSSEPMDLEAAYREAEKNHDGAQMMRLKELMQKKVR